MKEFCEMSKEEKKKFLSMDMIERIIRVEQTIASHFGEKLKYPQTNYFKSLSKERKKEFENYLKKKNGVNKILQLSAVIIPILFIILLRVEFTGNSIREIVGDRATSNLNYFLFIFILALVLILILLFLRKKAKDIQFNNKTKILYGIYNKGHNKSR